MSVKEKNRFIKTTAEAVGESPDDSTDWWLDTHRPYQSKKANKEHAFIAVQVYKDKDPNNFVRHTNMQLLFTDQAESYVVCKECYSIYARMQWSGSTRASEGWRARAGKKLQTHEATKGWCQFCDPVFGNGGWHL